MTQRAREGTSSEQARLLCPVDLFEHSSLILRYARAVAAERGERIVLLTVMERLLQAAVLVHEAQRLERDLLADLETFNDEVLPTPATRPECRVRKGTPYAEILAASREEHCDFIVMGTHGRRGLTKMFLGSTLERVMRQTTVPVLAIPPGANGLLSSVDAERLSIQRVLVGVDFEAPSLAAARVAASVASRYGAGLSLLHVVPRRTSGPHLESQVQEEDSERARKAEHEVCRLAKEFCTEHISAVGHVVPGETEEVIAGQASEEPRTLVVLGLRTAKDPSGALPGATAYRVLQLSKAPVIVVPTPDA